MPSLNEIAQQALRAQAVEALKSQGLDPEHLGAVKEITVSEWEGWYRDADGEDAKTKPMSATKLVLHPTWESGPAWPVVQPAKPTTIKPNRPKPVRTDGWKTAVVLPDPQIGFRRVKAETDEEGLEPFHDEAAIEVALNILAAVRKAHPIDRVVNLGDFLDLPSQGKYAQEAGFALTTQLAVNYGHEFLARQRAICPEAKIDVIEGNHDKRLGDYVARNAMAAFGLRQAGAPPSSWPTLSIPYLLRTDDLGVTWNEGYPAAGVWLNDHIECIHGIKVRSSGSTASAVINDSRHSVIFGHVHRIEVQHKTDRARASAYKKFAASPGCLCRVDGKVPSFHSATNREGAALTYHENWQQGLMVVHYREDSHEYSLEMVEINEGRAMWRGKEYGA